MTQLEKLALRLTAERGPSDLADVERLLHGHGWRRTSGKGSHVVFKKPGSRPITMGTLHGRKLKRIYVVDVLHRLGLQE